MAPIVSKIILDLPPEIDDGVGIVQNFQRVFEYLVALRFSLLAVEESAVELSLKFLELFLGDFGHVLFPVVEHRRLRRLLAASVGAAAEKSDDGFGARQQVERRRDQHRRVAVAQTEYGQVEFPFCAVIVRTMVIVLCINIYVVFLKAGLIEQGKNLYPFIGAGAWCEGG